MQRGRDSPHIVVEEEKHGDSASMHALCSWAVPGHCFSHASRPREAWPTACGWHLGEEQHPHLSMLALGNIPDLCGGFSLCYFCEPPHAPCAVQPMVSCRRLGNSRYILVNTVVFLLGALRSKTRTLFSFQDTTGLFSHRMSKPEMQGPKPQTLNHCLLRGMACGGIKPFFVSALGSYGFDLVGSY